jgi:hypothetical protein
MVVVVIGLWLLVVGGEVEKVPSEQPAGEEPGWVAAPRDPPACFSVSAFTLRLWPLWKPRGAGHHGGLS